MVQRTTEKEKNVGILRRAIFWLLRFCLTAGFFVYIFCYLIHFDDTLTLKDGSIVSGKIIKQSSEGVLFKTADEKIWLDKEKRSDGQVWVDRNDLHPQKGVSIGFWTVVQNLNIPIFVCFSLFFFIDLLINTFRFQWLLRPQNICLSYSKTFQINLIGFFFNNFLPGSSGGDLVRAYYVCKESEGVTKAVIAVIMDRMTGLGALVILASIMVSFQLGKPEFQLPAIFIYSCLAAGCLGILWMLYFPERFFAKKNLLFFRVIEAFCTYRQHFAIVVKSITLTFLVHILSNMAILGFALSIGIKDVPWYVFFIYVPIGFLVSALPISLAGWGVGEATTAYLFAQIGVPAEQAVMLSILSRLGTMWVSLPGGIVWFYKPLQSR